MGGGIDTIAITATTDKLGIMECCDNFSSTQVDASLTVGGQVVLTPIQALSPSSRYGGGQSADAARHWRQRPLVDSTITGGSEVDTIGISTSGMVLGARAFINGNVGADVIYVNNAAAATVRGGSEGDTITVQAGGADGSSFYGDKGADTITDLGGNSSLFGGDGADTLIGGEGVDLLTGGAGADNFSVADTHENTGNTIELTTITDFVAGTDKIGAIGIADIEQGVTADLISAGDATSITASEAISITTLTGATNMTATSGNVLLASSSTAFTAATLSDALKLVDLLR